MLLTLSTAANTPLTPHPYRSARSARQCDVEGMRTVMHRNMDGLVMEQGIVRLRHKQHAKKSAFTSKPEFEKERHGGAEGPREAGLERCVGVIVI